MDIKTEIKQVSKRDYRTIQWLIILSAVFFIFSIIGTGILLFRQGLELGIILSLIIAVTLDILFIVLFVIFLSWFLYLLSYKKVQTKKLQDPHAISLFYTMKTTYIIVKWITFGWWLTKRYDYRKQMGIK